MTPAPQLCHVFAFVEPGAPERAALESAGLRESFRRRHPGQGTANVCYCFDNAYLELLWIEDGADAESPAIVRTRLAERARWRDSGTCPFGISVRTERPGQPLPFPTWNYRPPYLPAGMAIPVALSSEDPRQPFLFRSPGDARPDAWTDGRAGDRQRPAGLADIAGLHLALPPGVAAAPDLAPLCDAGWLTVDNAAAGEPPRMTLTLSASDGGPPRRLSLPDCRWID